MNLSSSVPPPCHTSLLCFLTWTRHESAVAPLVAASARHYLRSRAVPGIPVQRTLTAGRVREAPTCVSSGRTTRGTREQGWDGAGRARGAGERPRHALEHVIGRPGVTEVTRGHVSHGSRQKQQHNCRQRSHARDTGAGEGCEGVSEARYEPRDVAAGVAVRRWLCGCQRLTAAEGFGRPVVASIVCVMTTVSL